MSNTLFNDDAMVLYEQLLAEGKIEVLDYDSPNEETKASFLEKWLEQMGTNYDADELTLYIGAKGKKGKFYVCYEDFFYRLEGENESACEQLIKEVLK